MSISIIKKLAGDTVIYGLGSILPRLLTFILTPYLTNKMPSMTGYGDQSLLYSYIAVFNVLLAYRLETAYFRFGVKNEENSEATFPTAMTSLIGTTAIFLVLGFVFIQPFAALIGIKGQTEWMGLVLLILAFDALCALPYAKLRLENKAKKFSIIKIINVLLYIGLVFFFFDILPNWKNIELSEKEKVTYIFLANAFASGISFLLLLPELIKTKWQFDKILWKKIIRYAAPLIIVGLAGMINEVFDRILLQKMLNLPPEQVSAKIGAYSGCYKIATFMTLFIQAFNYAVEPFFFKNADKSDSKVVYGKVTQVFALVASLAFVTIILYLDIFKYYVHKNYWEALGVVPILLLANFFLGLYYNFSTWYKISDNTNIGATISIIGATITIVANYLLIPKMGYWGSAWATLICYFYMAVATYWQGKIHYPIQYPISRMIFYILAAIFIVGISFLLKNTLNLNLIPTLAINTILLLIYIGGIFYLEKDNFIRKKA